MARPKLLGIRYARMAAPVREAWQAADEREAAAMLKSLATFEMRVKSNPLAGDPVARDKWPEDLRRDYGEIPNLFRFELAARWRGYYALVGQPGGVMVHVLYLWDHETYSAQSGYSKK